jgi:hypothetical protein
VNPPRRYRVALLAFPRAARSRHAADLLGVLYDADGEHGSPSWREAAHLVIAGLGLRIERGVIWLMPLRLLLIAGVVAAAGAFAPGAAWGQRMPGPGRYYVIAGPTPALRWALLAAAVLAVTLRAQDRGFKRLAALSVAASALGFALAFLSTVHGPGFPAARLGIAPAISALPSAAAFGAAILLALLALSRLSPRHRARSAAVCMGLAYLAALGTTLQGDPQGNLGVLSPRQLGPAGLMIATTLALGIGAALAKRHFNADAPIAGANR